MWHTTATKDKKFQSFKFHPFLEKGSKIGILTGKHLLGQLERLATFEQDNYPSQFFFLSLSLLM